MIPLLEKFPKAQSHRGPLENTTVLELTPKPSRQKQDDPKALASSERASLHVNSFI